MGTRNVICIASGGEYKVAQYSQWDGYPEGQGKDILDFLTREGNIDRLKANLSKVRFLDIEGVDKELVEDYDNNAPEWSNQPDNRTPDQKRWELNYLSRDVGAKILANIANATEEEILLKNSLDFVKDGLFCEWIWLVDFDNGTFGSCKGLDEDQKLEAGVTFQLESLPPYEEFFAAFKSDDI